MSRPPSPKPGADAGDRIAEKASSLIRELIYEKWPEIAEVWREDEDGDVGIGARVTLSGNPRECAIHVRLNWARRYSVEADATLDDPDQMSLGLEAGEAA
ncbi:MAG: hypothetical protein IT577_00425 [Verrucomicrobiae bacterium]|nr:hypothetical protein [Verrucomicrobiae bacterium]